MAKAKGQAAAREIVRRKPESERKADVIRVRVTADQRRTMQAGADDAGLDLSGWLRMLGLREGKKATAPDSKG